MLDFQIIQEDWKAVDAECIVLPVNPDLTPAFRSTADVLDAADCEPFQEITYEFGSTRAMWAKCSGMRATHIIKLIFSETETGCTIGRQLHYQRCITKAIFNHNSVAIPLLTDSFDKAAVKEALEIAVRIIVDLKVAIDKMSKTDNRVLLVVPDDAALQIGLEILRSLEADDAWKLAERTLFASIDRRKLRKCIDVLRSLETLETNRKYYWDSAGMCGDHSYPQELTDVFYIMEDDYEYRKNMAEIRRKDLLPTELTLQQIQTCLTWLKKDECHLVPLKANDGTLLKLLLRLDDLLQKKYRWYS